MFMYYEDFLQLMGEDIRSSRRLINTHNITYEYYRIILDELSKCSKSIYLFNFSGSSVSRDPASEKWDAIEHRVRIVHAQLERVIKFISLGDFKIAYEFDDMANDSDMPVFSFHKRSDYNGLVLLPDFEIFENNYYAKNTFFDEHFFVDKLPRAIFVGSTTGTNAREDRIHQNTIHNIDTDPSVRIEAAKYFIHSNDVLFRLPSIVQCDAQETEDYLRSFSFCNPRCIDWQEQFNYRYLISVDGNGPTLTRVAVALLSNSVLLKYDSSWIAYYHRALHAGKNYIAIKSHNDIEDVVKQSELMADEHYHISNNSSSNFGLIFQRANVDRYIGAVLNEFRSIFYGKDHIYDENRRKLDQVAHLDIDAHISNVGDVSFWPELDVVAPHDNFIEGLAIYPASALFSWHELQYQVIFDDKQVSEIVRGGQYIGTKGQSRGIIGFRMSIASERKIKLNYLVKFSDGVELSSGDGRWVVHDGGRIVRLAFDIQAL